MASKPKAEITAEQQEARLETQRRYRARKRQEDPETFYAKNQAVAARYWERHRERLNTYYRERERERRAFATPEQLLELSAKAKERYHRNKDADPEGFLQHQNERQRLARSVKMAKDPEQVHAAERRRDRGSSPLKDATGRKLYADLRRAVPTTWARQDRDEVIGMVLMAVSDGTVRVKDAVGAIKRYTTQNNRDYDTFKSVSLDALHPETGKAWIDNLDSETPHF
ncbi:MAG TPA: hypothetical protein VGN60_01430 [Devosia sp.]|jgi:hypothetical protein|nr:hypothetical protein [Devosia sp.]